MIRRIRQISMVSEKGQTMTEFAIILPMLALLLLGIMQFAVAFNNYVTVTDAARAGARKAAVGRDLGNPAGAAEAAARNSAPNLDQGKFGVSVNSSFERGSDVTVSTSYPFEISLLGLVVKSGQLTSTTTERVE